MFDNVTAVKAKGHGSVDYFVSVNVKVLTREMSPKRWILSINYEKLQQGKYPRSHVNFVLGMLLNGASSHH